MMTILVNKGYNNNSNNNATVNSTPRSNDHNDGGAEGLRKRAGKDGARTLP